MKVIISYLLIFIIITLFTLFLDATSGLFVLIIFISAIVISLLLHLYALKRFDCTLSIESRLLERKDEVKLFVKLPKAWLFLPTVFEICLDISEHLECSDSTGSSYTVTLGRKAKQKSFLLKAAYWGKATVGIKSIRARDILGLFNHSISINAVSSQISQLSILPSVPELSQGSELVRALNDASAYDDNEQNREIPFAMVGFPGYEHRDYAPGDPLKSVNWKLSAKRDRLLVRKPEAYAGGDQVLILSAKAGTKLIHEQTAIESMLALARVLTKQEILCRIYVCFSGNWRIFEVVGEGEIEKLRYELIEYCFVEGEDQLPDLADEKASGILAFTAEPSVTMLNETISDNWHIQELDGEIVFRRGGVQ